MGPSQRVNKNIASRRTGLILPIFSLRMRRNGCLGAFGKHSNISVRFLDPDFGDLRRFSVKFLSRNLKFRYIYTSRLFDLLT